MLRTYNYRVRPLSSAVALSLCESPLRRSSPISLYAVRCATSVPPNEIWAVKNRFDRKISSLDTGEKFSRWKHIKVERFKKRQLLLIPDFETRGKDVSICISLAFELVVEDAVLAYQRQTMDEYDSVKSTLCNALVFDLMTRTFSEVLSDRALQQKWQQLANDHLDFADRGMTVQNLRIVSIRPGANNQYFYTQDELDMRSFERIQQSSSAYLGLVKQLDSQYQQLNRLGLDAAVESFSNYLPKVNQLVNNSENQMAADALLGIMEKVWRSPEYPSPKWFIENIMEQKKHEPVEEEQHEEQPREEENEDTDTQESKEKEGESTAPTEKLEQKPVHWS